jgi:hypothetical protein
MGERPPMPARTVARRSAHVKTPTLQFDDPSSNRHAPRRRAAHGRLAPTTLDRGPGGRSSATPDRLRDPGGRSSATPHRLREPRGGAPRRRIVTLTPGGRSSATPNRLREPRGGAPRRRIVICTPGVWSSATPNRLREPRGGAPRRRIVCGHTRTMWLPWPARRCQPVRTLARSPTVIAAARPRRATSPTCRAPRARSRRAWRGARRCRARCR